MMLSQSKPTSNLIRLPSVPPWYKLCA